MNRLPMPEPIRTRPDEYWRVVPEVHMEVVYEGGCTQHPKGTTLECRKPAVAKTTRGTLLLCGSHLRDSGMWIERGTVVSWMLVKA